MKNKYPKKETSLALYLIIGAVAVLIAVVVYYNGPDFNTLLGYFTLLIVVSLFYSYRVCIFTALVSIISYGAATSYLIYNRTFSPGPLDLLVQLSYFLAITAIITWLVSKIQTAKKQKDLSPPSETLNAMGQSVLESLNTGVIILDKKGEISFINNYAAKLLRLKKQEVLKAKMRSLSDPAFKSLYKVLNTDRDAKATATSEVKITKPKQTILLVTTAPIHYQGQKYRLVKVIHDVTRQREVDRMKSELISIVSHQLRTPLSAVKWGLKMLLDGDAGKLTTEQKSIVGKGYHSNERMIHLVNDLLNISRIEEGRFIFKFKKESLEKLLERTIKEFKYALEEKSMNLVYDGPQKPLPEIEMDIEKLHVVIQNIINNAIIYTPSNGQIKISCKRKDEQILISVQDNGMGIPKKQQHRLFTKFFRADNAIKMQTEGSGLGLFIAKNIVEKHKGKISAKSKQDQGSTFTISLPINPLNVNSDQ